MEKEIIVAWHGEETTVTCTSGFSMGGPFLDPRSREVLDLVIEVMQRNTGRKFYEVKPERVELKNIEKSSETKIYGKETKVTYHTSIDLVEYRLHVYFV